MDNRQVDQLIINALSEDSGNGDATSERIFEREDTSVGYLIAKEFGILAGTKIFSRVFQLLDEGIDIEWFIGEGSKLEVNDRIAKISGSTITILRGERIALNLLQRMSGIASLTRLFVDEVSDYSCRIVDTRKTTPGLRLIEKYAVRVGGGYNHRFNLSDAIMIKDNHIQAAGGLTNAIKKVKESCPHTMKVEVEIETLDDLEDAIQAGVDIIMLDNMPAEDMAKGVQKTAGRVILEASGNVSLDTIGLIASTGVDVISCGKLTHSAMALDMSLKF